jgi:alcohol dehydrogenase class IV
LPVLADFRRTLSGLEAGVYSGVQGNPVASQVRAGVDAYRAHRADSVIGFGGGAALDVAKVVALMAVHPGNVLEYAWDHPKARPIEKALPHFVALPTTAGTGSEVGRSSVILEDDTHVKRIVFSPAILAKAVFADPELTLALPASITAATGMDALTHNIESYLSPAYHPLCDGIALEGVRIAARALPDCGQGARKSPGAQRHADGVDDGRDRVPEGSRRGALVRARALDRRRPASRTRERRDDRSRHEVQPAGRGSEDGGARARGGRPDLIAWLTELKREIGIPAQLGVLGVKREQLPRLVEVALADTCHQTNPRPCSEQDFENLFEAAL